MTLSDKNPNPKTVREKASIPFHHNRFALLGKMDHCAAGGQNWPDRLSFISILFRARAPEVTRPLHWKFLIPPPYSRHRFQVRSLKRGKIENTLCSDFQLGRRSRRDINCWRPLFERVARRDSNIRQQNRDKT